MPDDNAIVVISEVRQPCPYCGDAGEVSGVVGDVQFFFQCPCSGGNEEAVRWLLCSDSSEPPGEGWVV